MEDFVDKSTPWKEAGSYIFTDNDGVTGLYRKEAEYSGRAWSIKILTESQEWSTATIPKLLPTDSVGSYSYLIELSAFTKDRKSLIRDFLWPWDLRNVSKTMWSVKEHENGSIRVGYSKHGVHRHIRRYITYFMNGDENIPTSKVLFQYIVGPNIEEDNDDEQATSSNQVKNENTGKPEEQKKERRKTSEKALSKKIATTVEDEVELFLNECTPWGEGDCYKFDKNGVTGLYRKEPTYSGRAWALTVLKQKNDWAMTKMPTHFPLNSAGSFRFLVDPQAFLNFEKRRNPIPIDLLHPWDGRGTNTKWSNTTNPTNPNGKVRHATSRHAVYKNIRRYITFLTERGNLPSSPVLYEYIVEYPARRPQVPKPSTSKSISTNEKRKRDTTKEAKEEEVDDFDWDEAPQQNAKRRKSDLSEVKERAKKMSLLDYPSAIPTPPISEPSNDTPTSSKAKKVVVDPIFIDLEQSFGSLQQSISDLKNRYCSLTIPYEMTAMNKKIIRLLDLETEIKDNIGNLAENTRNTIRDIMMDMEEPLPTFPAPPMPLVQDNSAMDPWKHVVVKIE